ncbi:MAG: hypothetical protein ACK5M4_13400 [Pseudorhodobacter sp.]
MGPDLLAPLPRLSGKGALDHSIAALVARWKSGELEEGIAAFFEKRLPRWAGQAFPASFGQIAFRQDNLA